MYKALYRAYRPEVFSDMLGQEHIVRILESQLASGSVSHAYLFCGTRGTGKTTVARLLAKGLNCLSDDVHGRPCGVCEHCRSIAAGNFIDIVEIDAASNNGVEDVRELRESVNYPPVAGRTKVYVIDEVHMMSKNAFNALLKTLEEPPESVVFILCTTEPEKLPATVLSRCMRMDFRRVPGESLAQRVRQICVERDILMEESAVRVIVAAADGSARDCLTLLDQCIAGRKGTVTRDDVLESLGGVGEEVYVELTERVADNDPAGALMIIDRLIKGGRDSRQILQGWMAHYRNLMMTKFIRDPQDVLSMSVENIERISSQAHRTDIELINNAIVELAATIAEARGTNQPRVLLEICAVKLATTTADGRYVSVNMEKARRMEERRSDAEEGRAVPEEGSSNAEGHRSNEGGSSNAEERRTAPEGGSSNAEERRAVPEERRSDAEERRAAPEEGNSNAEVRSGADDDEIRPPVIETDYPDDGYFDDEIDAIWAEIIEDGESQTNTFTIVRTGAVPIKMNDSEFVIKVSGQARKYLEKNREPMEQLIARYAGRYHKMILRSEQEDDGRASLEETAEKASRILGTKVDIK